MRGNVYLLLATFNASFSPEEVQMHDQYTKLMEEPIEERLTVVWSLR